MELYLPLIYPTKPHRGFAFGNIPKNKGRKQIEYIQDPEKLKRMHSNLTPKIQQKGTLKMAELRSKPVVCIKAGKLMGDFKSASEAAAKTGINATNISACCRGRRLSSGGFRWFYRDESHIYAELINPEQIDWLAESEKILHHHRLTLDQIRSKNNTDRYSGCRTLLYKYLREEVGMEYKAIAQHLHRGASTVTQMVQRFNDRLSVGDKDAVSAWKIVEEICKTKRNDRAE